MRQSDIRERVVVPLIRGMNLVDMKVYTDNDGEVTEVLLKYSVPTGGPEQLSGGVCWGRSHIDRDAMA